MWKSISLFLAGALTAFLVFFKMKSPEVVNVQGDLIEDQKVKDASKNKISRADRKTNRINKRRIRRLNK